MNPVNQFKDRYLFYAFLMLAAVIALPMGITNIFSGLLLVAFLIHDKLNNVFRGIMQNILLKIICAYFFLVVLFSFREPNINQALDEVIKRLMIVLPLFFYGSNVSSEGERKVLSVYVLAVTLSCLISFFLTLPQLKPGDDFYQFSWNLSNYSVFSSNYLALYVAFAIIIVVHGYFSGALLNKFYNSVLFIILLLYLTLLGSRTAFFSMAVICCGYLIIRSFGNRRHIIYAAFLVAGLVLLVLLVPYFKSRIVVLYTVGFEADARYYQLMAAKAILKENFLLGLGYSGAKEAMVKQFELIGFHEGVANSFNAHNQFIQSAIVFGMLGFALTLSMYAVMLVAAIRTKRFLPVAFCLLFTLCSLTESLLERNKGIIFFSFFTGLLLTTKLPPDTTLRPASNSQKLEL